MNGDFELVLWGLRGYDCQRWDGIWGCGGLVVWQGQVHTKSHCRLQKEAHVGLDKEKREFPFYFSFLYIIARITNTRALSLNNPAAYQVIPCLALLPIARSIPT